MPDPAPWECPRCHCLFERPGYGHEPCGDSAAVILAEAKRTADALAFACRVPDKVPDFSACGGPAAEAYWSYFTPARVASFLAAVEAVLELHHPKPLYGLAFGGLGQDKPLCAHDPDTDPDAHFEGDDGYWYCRDKITAQACAQCADEDAADLWAEWPCPTYLAITSALTGEQATEPPQTEDDRRAAAEALTALRERLAGDGN